MSICERLEAVRDYALDELPQPGIEQHLQTCTECAGEFDRLRLTTAALRMLPNQEIPQRIAFISDKVFEPTRAGRFFASFWKPAMISTSMIAAALIVAHRPAAITAANPQPAVAALQTQDVRQQIDTAVAKAVADLRREDDRRLNNIVLASQRERQKEHAAVMEAVNTFQARQNAATLLAVADTTRSGAGQ